MRKVTMLLSFAILMFYQSFGQSAKSKFLSNEWSFWVFNNAIALPFSGNIGIIHKPLHPGIAAEAKHLWNTHVHHQIFQTFTAGVFYQQYVQTGVQLYSSFHYRYVPQTKFGAEVHVGLGYLHAFRDLREFKLDDNGQYQSVPNVGRPALMIPFGVRLGYAFSPHFHPFIGYQMWFQTPFSKEYIPILPNTSLCVGVHYTF